MFDIETYITLVDTHTLEKGGQERVTQAGTRQAGGKPEQHMLG